MGIYPNPGGHIIAALQVGDEVTIKAGAGWPKAQTNVVEIVIDVDRASALTHTGRILTCADGFSVKPTGVHYDDEGQYPSPVTEQARHLLTEANQAKAKRDADWQEIVDGFDKDDDPLELL